MSRTEQEIRSDLAEFARHERFDPLAKRLVGDIEPLLDRLAAPQECDGSCGCLLRRSAICDPASTPTPQDEPQQGDECSLCRVGDHVFPDAGGACNCINTGCRCLVTADPVTSTPEAATERCEHGYDRRHWLPPGVGSPPWRRVKLCPGPAPSGLQRATEQQQ